MKTRNDAAETPQPVTCMTCPYHGPIKQPGMVECRLNPPQLTHLAFPRAAAPRNVRLVNGGPYQPVEIGVQWYASFPAVDATQPCGQHPAIRVQVEAAIERAKAEMVAAAASPAATTA